MKYSLLVIAILSGFILSAQTKMIAHKSHGGSADNFHTALLSADELLAEADFGLGDMDMEERISRLDSVILNADGSVRIVTTFRSYLPYAPEPRDTSDWQTDIIEYVQHPLFNRQNTLAQIKRQLDRHWGYVNAAESAVFIGFDQEEEPVNDQQSEPQNEPQQPSPEPSPLRNKKQTQQSGNGQGQIELGAANDFTESIVLAQAPPSRSPNFKLLWLGLAGILIVGGRWVLRA